MNTIASDGTINPHCGKCMYLRRAKAPIVRNHGSSIQSDSFLQTIHAYYCINPEGEGRWWSGRPTYDCCEKFKHKIK